MTQKLTEAEVHQLNCVFEMLCYADVPCPIRSRYAWIARWLRFSEADLEKRFSERGQVQVLCALSTLVKLSDFEQALFILYEVQPDYEQAVRIIEAIRVKSRTERVNRLQFEVGNFIKTSGSWFASSLEVKEALCRLVEAFDAESLNEKRRSYMDKPIEILGWHERGRGEPVKLNKKWKS